MPPDARIHASGDGQDRGGLKPKDGKVRTAEEFGICSTESARKAAQYATRAAKRMTSNSAIVDRKQEEEVARFVKSEIKLGNLLGMGGFSNVFEVQSVTLEDNTLLGTEMEASSTSAFDVMDDREREHNARYQKSARDFIKMHCVRSGEEAGASDARYAIKLLRRDKMADPRLYKIGAADLVIEAKFLSCLEHPNIVKLRGVTSDGVQAFVTGEEGAYFLLMDRLYDTLSVRVLAWKKESNKYKGAMGKLKDRGGAKKKDLLIRQLCVAFDIAGALKYLHEQRVIYRDLKPQNLAFDIRGDVKLFDFGLAKELQESERDGDAYKMTGVTGNIRYMAPEVYKSQPYNLTADVYSFGLMLYDMVTMQKWWKSFDPKEHRKMVEQVGCPSIPDSWPAPLQSLVKRSLSPERADRLSMENVYNILRKLIVNLRDGDDVGLEHNRRRSTFVMQKKGPLIAGKGMDSRMSFRRMSAKGVLPDELDSLHGDVE